MKYTIIYILSFILISVIWIRAFVIENRLDAVEGLKMESRAESFSLMMTDTLVISDTLSLEPSAPVPDTVYYISPVTSAPPPSNFSLLGFSNELITLLVGLGNLFTLGFQFKNRNKKSKDYYDFSLKEVS